MIGGGVDNDPRLVDGVDIEDGEARRRRTVDVDDGGVDSFGGGATHVYDCLVYVNNIMKIKDLKCLVVVDERGELIGFNKEKSMERICLGCVWKEGKLCGFEWV